MNEKNLLVAIIAFVCVAFILLTIMMLRWAKTRPDLCENVYRKCDTLVKSKKYKYLLLGTYLFPMVTPQNQVALRLSLMTLFFFLLVPLGIKIVIGRTKVRATRVDKKSTMMSKDDNIVEDKNSAI